MQKIQNAACRVVLMAHKRTHVVDMHSKLNLMYLQERRDLHMAIITYKCVSGLAPAYLSVFFEPVDLVHGLHTRAAQNRDMVVRKGRTKIGDKAFQYYGLYIWNKIPVEVGTYITVQSFKTAYLRDKVQI